jgi:hypothetical protein
MDLTRLSRGEQMSGIAGIALFLIMIIFKWYGVKVTAGGFSGQGGTRNAFESYSFIDIILFITAVVAVALPLMSASQADIGLPVALSAVVAGLGILCVILIIIRIISPPDLEAGGIHVSDVPGADVTRKIGVWLGLIAAAGVAYGGWQAMQEEGTSFGGQADRLGGGPGEGPGASPPPPPPPPPPNTPTQ